MAFNRLLYDKQSKFLEQTVTKYEPGSTNKDVMELAIEFGCIMMSVHLVASEPEIDQARRSGNKLFEDVPFDLDLFNKSTERARSEDYDGGAKFEQDYKSNSAKLEGWDRQDKLTIHIYLIHIGSARQAFAREQQFFLDQVVEQFKLSDDQEIKDLMKDATHLFGSSTNLDYEQYETKPRHADGPTLLKLLGKALEGIGWAIFSVVMIVFCIFAWPLLFIWVVMIAPFASYPMALVKWFITDHHYFWEGLKDLIWALVPLINITYVWDWWVVIFAFIWGIFD